MMSTRMYPFTCFQASKSPGLIEVTNFLLSEMNRRFDYLTVESDPKFDCMFLLATAIDPNLRCFISDTQAEVILRHIEQVMFDLVSYHKFHNSFHVYFVYINCLVIFKKGNN